MKQLLTLRTLAACIALMLTASMAFAAPPARLPVQGVLTDTSDMPIEGTLPVTFTLYADAQKATMVWTETKSVTFAAGFFAEALGDIEALPLTLFRDEQTLYLGIAVDTDSEMALIEVLPVPFAAYAEHAGDAATLEGLSAADFTAAGADIPFSQLTGVPADIADGDDGTSFALAGGGGLELSAGTLRLLSSCTVGHVLKYTASGWACGVDESGSGGATITDVQLLGTTLSVVEGGTNHTVNLAALQDGVNDADNNPNNEHNVSMNLSGTTLTVVDNGGSVSANLASLQDGVNDADSDPTNERNTSMTLNGTTLELTDSGGTLTANLAPLAGGGGVRMAYESGSVPTVTATRAWLVDPVVATIAAGETIQITSSAAFGTNATAAAGLDIYPCYRTVGNTGPPIAIGLGMFNLTLAADSRTTFGINGVVTIATAGDYEFGMCGDDDGDGNWTSNEWSYTSVIIKP